MSTDRIAVDANGLVYALYRDTPQHVASRAFLERARRGELTLCLTSQVLAEFLSIVTSVKRVSDPRTAEEATAASPPLRMGHTALAAVEAARGRPGRRWPTA